VVSYSEFKAGRLFERRQIYAKQRGAIAGGLTIEFLGRFSVSIGGRKGVASALNLNKLVNPGENCKSLLNKEFLFL
jgi:hypothetical protein